MNKDKPYRDRLVVSPKLRKIIEVDCANEYRRVHKLEQSFKLSHEKILVSMARFYLGNDLYNQEENNKSK